MTKFLMARVTHLEMQSRQYRVVPPPMGARMALVCAEHMPVHFYRYLYEQVGKKHHWQKRRKMDDKALSDLLHDDSTLVYVLYIEGCPAGFAEISFANLPEVAEIVYFGLVPDYQGRGFSRFFFHEIVNAAWEREPGKLKIQTNSLDNPRALQLYQSVGFSPVSFSEEQIVVWK